MAHDEPEISAHDGPRTGTIDMGLNLNPPFSYLDCPISATCLDKVAKHVDCAPGRHKRSSANAHPPVPDTRSLVTAI